MYVLFTIRTDSSWFQILTQIGYTFYIVFLTRIFYGGQTVRSKPSKIPQEKPPWFRVMIVVKDSISTRVKGMTTSLSHRPAKPSYVNRSCKKWFGWAIQFGSVKCVIQFTEVEPVAQTHSSGPSTTQALIPVWPHQTIITIEPKSRKRIYRHILPYKYTQTTAATFGASITRHCYWFYSSTCPVLVSVSL